MPAKPQAVPILLGILLVLGLGGLVSWRFVQEIGAAVPDETGDERPVAVEVARIERGRIEQTRTFNGTLEPAARFRVSAKVGGRVARLAVDFADPVSNGQRVAALDADEFEQALRRADADLAVAQAELNEAESVVQITRRTLDRQTSLRERGVASDVAVDEATSSHLAAQARVAVAEASVTRAEAAVATAQTRLGYTQVRAVWEEGDDERIVAQRLVEPGDTVAANAELLEIIEIDPLRAVMFVAERDYAALRAGQRVQLRTDAFPGERFAASVARVSPVFTASSRQARVELDVPNAGQRLRPGMFVRAETVLKAVDDAQIVPELAVVRRDDRPAVFVFEPTTQTARLVPVQLGLTQAGRVQVESEELPPAGWVITMGQRFVDDGSAVRRVEPPPSGPASSEAP